MGEVIMASLGLHPTTKIKDESEKELCTWPVNDEVSGWIEATPQQVRIRSLHSQEPGLLILLNSCKRPARVLWLSYEGNEVYYRVIAPGRSSTFRTFKTHPWIARDSDTGDRLMLGNRMVAFAEGTTAITQPDELVWTMASHKYFPVPFRQLARALLLANHRSCSLAAARVQEAEMAAEEATAKAVAEQTALAQQEAEAKERELEMGAGVMVTLTLNAETGTHAVKGKAVRGSAPILSHADKEPSECCCMGSSSAFANNDHMDAAYHPAARSTSLMVQAYRCLARTIGCVATATRLVASKATAEGMPDQGPQQAADAPAAGGLGRFLTRKNRSGYSSTRSGQRGRRAIHGFCNSCRGDDDGLTAGSNSALFENLSLLSSDLLIHVVSFLSPVQRQCITMAEGAHPDISPALLHSDPSTWPDPI